MFVSRPRCGFELRLLRGLACGVCGGILDEVANVVVVVVVVREVEGGVEEGSLRCMKGAGVSLRAIILVIQSFLHLFDSLGTSRPSKGYAAEDGSHGRVADR